MIKTWVKCDIEQLIEAVCSDNYADVQRCLIEGVTPNCLVNNISVLAHATEMGYFNVVLLLLENGANPDVLLHGRPLIFRVLAGGQFAMAKALLKKLISPEKITVNGKSLLHCFTKINDVEQVKLLLSYIKPAFARNSDNGDIVTSLYAAVSHGHLEIVNQFFRAGLNLNDLTFSPSENSSGGAPDCLVINAMRRGYTEIAQVLVDNGYRFDMNKLSEFFKSYILWSASDGIEFCLKNGVDPNMPFFSCSPVMNLIYRGQVRNNNNRVMPSSMFRSLEVLVRYGADIHGNLGGSAESHTLLSFYIQIEGRKMGGIKYDLLKRMLFLGARVCDIVEMELIKSEYFNLVVLADYLGVPGDFKVLKKKLLVQKILTVMTLINSTRDGSLANLSFSVIASNILHHREPDKAIESLPLSVILKNRLKAFV